MLWTGLDWTEGRWGFFNASESVDRSVCAGLHPSRTSFLPSFLCLRWGELGGGGGGEEGKGKERGGRACAGCEVGVADCLDLLSHDGQGIECLWHGRREHEGRRLRAREEEFAGIDM